MNWPNFNLIKRSSSRTLIKALDRVVNDVIDGLQEPQVRRWVNRALDWLRPHVQSLGLRISHLTRSKIEIVLPAKKRNLKNRSLHLESAVVAAAAHAFETLWAENAPPGDFQVHIAKIQLQKQAPLQGNLRVRWVLEDFVRENIFAEIKKNKSTAHEAHIQIFNEGDQLVAEVVISAELGFLELLEWK